MNRKWKTITFLKENIGENLYDLGKTATHKRKY